jgi:hypothetical protein
VSTVRVVWGCEAIAQIVGLYSFRHAIGADAINGAVRFPSQEAVAARLATEEKREQAEAYVYRPHQLLFDTSDGSQPIASAELLVPTRRCALRIWRTSYGS